MEPIPNSLHVYLQNAQDEATKIYTENQSLRQQLLDIRKQLEQSITDQTSLQCDLDKSRQTIQDLETLVGNLSKLVEIKKKRIEELEKENEELSFQLPSTLSEEDTPDREKKTHFFSKLFFGS